MAEAYGSTEVSERHRHRYEVNNAYRDALTKAGLHISGTSPDGRLVEFVELDREPAPVLRGHPGAPGAEEPADPAAPAVRRRSSGRRSPTAQADQLPVDLGRARPSRAAADAPTTAGRERRRGRRRRAAAARRERRRAPRTRCARAPSGSPGRIFSVVTDEVTMPGGGAAARDYVRHVGAVGVVALDDAGRVVLVRQYRHPVGRHLWELPAGLIDVAGEDLAAGRGCGSWPRRPT